MSSLAPNLAAPSRSLARPWPALGLGGLLLAAASGCVTVYQPMVSLQRPVVVDHRLPNFEGTRLLLRCVPGDEMPPADAELLCRKVGILFQNQGAQVEHEVPREGRSSRLAENGQAPHLVLDLRSRRLHQERSGLLLLLSVLTFTVVPSVEEMSFAQEVTVRGPDGSLLASDTFQARFVEYTGIGVWGTNAVLDLLVRPEPERLGSAAGRDFSRDFYGQLSQMVFNARVRAQVLQGFEPAPPSPASPVGLR